MTSETLGFVASIALVLGAALLVSSSALPRRLKNLIYAALVLRVVGAWLRHYVLFHFYRGSGDARIYFRRGRELAEQYWQFDFTPLYNLVISTDVKWWGTPFVPYPTSFVIGLIGPSLLGSFVIFGLLSFVGLIGFVLAFRRSYPEVPITKYARWVWLFPSLWYWPSSIGKDAILLMGLGLATAGFIGRKGRISWVLLVVGLFLVFAIRPQVAAVVILSFLLAYWSTLNSRWTLTKTVQTVVLLGVGLFGIWFAMKNIGVDGFDVEGVQDYMEAKAGSSGGSGLDSQGSFTGARERPGSGSSFEGVTPGLSSIPFALMNILFRPFPWEVHNLMAVLSSAELWGMWVIMWLRRHSLVQALKGWRHDRFVATALSFVLIYSVTLGMLMANLGLIARQRIFLFPFLFLLLEAVPRVARAQARPRLPQPVPALAMQRPHHVAIRARR